MTEKGDQQIRLKVLELKQRKTRCKSAFTRAKNKLLDSLATTTELNREEIRDLKNRFEGAYEDVYQSLEALCLEYNGQNDTENESKTIEELDSAESEYSRTHSAVRKAIDKSVKIPEIETKSESLGKDMWKQLKRISIPVFNGDKKKYESWRAAFDACVDQAPATPEYKLLQLRQYLSGEALKTIDSLGHSPAAYTAARERLERKFGGQRRRLNLYLEELSSFPPFKDESANTLEKFSDLLDIAVINLQEAEKESDLVDGALYYMLQKKMPRTMLTRYHRWISENHKDESVEILREWVVNEAKYQTIAAETVFGLSDKGDKKFDRHHSGRMSGERAYQVNTNNASFRNSENVCKMCLGSHGIWQCNEFERLPCNTRWFKAKELNLCFRCLGDGHLGQNCTRGRRCNMDGCRKNHHRLLHRVETERLGNRWGNNAQSTVTRQPRNESVHTALTQKEVTVALRVVPVVLRNQRKQVKINALLDDGSTRTYLNADVAAELGLHANKQKVVVNVLNGKSETFESMPVTVNLESLDGQVNIKMDVQTTKNVTGNLQPVDWKIHGREYPHLSGILFPPIESSKRVDMLIGLDYADLHCSYTEVRGRRGEPTARLTPLGWTCVGSVKSEVQPQSFHTFLVNERENELAESIRQLWEIEESGLSEKTMSMKDEQILQTTEKSIKFDSERYEIAIPWKETEFEMRNNYEMAKRRLLSTERKLQKTPEVEDIYKEMFVKYTEKGYISKQNQSEQEQNRWYLPHFPVVRMDKSTTKVRVVFDASAKYDKLSLNDMIHEGPSLQNDLFEILIRFRSKAVAVVCDVQEMYLQVGIPIADRKFHSFLWRDSPEEEPQVYEFNRLVFGVNASPFLAQLTTQTHAKKYAKTHPLAAKVILQDTYMDDSLTSVDSEKEGVSLYYQLSDLWRKAGMHARKWLSNSQVVLEHIPAEDRVFETDVSKEILPKIKTLGVLWLAETDMFSFSFKTLNSETKLTKRAFFSKVSSVYDPLGFLTPYTIRSKVLMQELWLRGIDWDEEISEKQSAAMWKWFRELEDLENIQIPRNLSFNKYEGSELHTFSDASNQAYGTVVFIRNIEENKFSVNLVASKCKVAPLKTVSISRLELMAAVLGLKLTKTICKALETDIRQVYFWSDSMNVLYWIRNQSRQFKPFVANRVGEIQSQTEPQQWRHVPTKENPADLLSRGLKVSELAENKLWWNGPSFLQQLKEEWPENKFEPDSNAKCESKVKSSSGEQQCLMTYKVCSDGEQNQNFRLAPERYSNWKRYVRIFAWTMRFIENCQLAVKERNVSRELHVSEIQNTESKIISAIQADTFKVEYECLLKGKRIPDSSKLLCLNPVLDEEGVIRCNSRLKFIEHLSNEGKYPIILPRSHSVTKLIVRDVHEKGNHCGTNQTLSFLSARFWILSAREVIREVENECSACRRIKAKTSHQVMGPLPSFRVSTSMRAFSETAVDYAGPFITKQGRGKTRSKRYLCLFTCMACRAVHLEMSYSLDADSFINAFYRFVNRRGLPKLMLSDNGTNFVGAVNELKELQSQLDNPKITRSAANRGVEWKFIPPGTPHFGGVHESMIKSAKRALFAILGNADITDEELTTAFSGAESLLNSRPLTYQSSNPADNCVLTPNHFLFGQLGGEFAPENIDTERFNIKKRWRRVQELVKHFWSRWFREFLPCLSSRKKWHRDRRDFIVGDVVMVIDPDSTRGSWTLGRINQVHPGADGHVRVVTVQIGGKLQKKPVHRICLLEAAE